MSKQFNFRILNRINDFKDVKISNLNSLFGCRNICKPFRTYPWRIYFWFNKQVTFFNTKYLLSTHYWLFTDKLFNLQHTRMLRTQKVESGTAAQLRLQPASNRQPRLISLQVHGSHFWRFFGYGRRSFLWRRKSSWTRYGLKSFDKLLILIFSLYFSHVNVFILSLLSSCFLI